MASKSITAVFSSSIGRKFVTAVTGLFLVFFSVGHLVGNLSLLVSADAFNYYAHTLMSLGPLLYFIETVLLAAFVAHAVYAIQVSWQNRKARPQRYSMVTGSGDPSYKTVSSVSMIYTGILLLIFLVVHLKTFKFGPYYETTVDGVVMRDLYTVVIEAFSNPLYAFGYAIMMVLLGFHLRHGFWSALQSLGLNRQRNSKSTYAIGVGIALILAAGFVFLPVYIYFTNA